MEHTHLSNGHKILTELEPVLDALRKYSTVEEFIKNKAAFQAKLEELYPKKVLVSKKEERFRTMLETLWDLSEGMKLSAIEKHLRTEYAKAKAGKLYIPGTEAYSGVSRYYSATREIGQRLGIARELQSLGIEDIKSLWELAIKKKTESTGEIEKGPQQTADYPELVNVRGHLTNSSNSLISPQVKSLVGMKIKIKRVDLKGKLGTYTGDILIQRDLEKIPKVRPELYGYAPKTEKDVICHEVGHAIELYLPDELLAKFNDIRAKEIHPSGFNVTGAYRTPMDWREDFAESFSKWVNHPKLFRKNFPLRAKYFDELGLTVKIGKDSVTIVKKEGHLRDAENELSE